jgi:hypothetical protein
MTSTGHVSATDPDSVRAVYQPRPVAWLFIIVAPLVLAAVAVALLSSAILLPNRSGLDVVSVLWSLFALATVYRFVTRWVVRAELTDTAMRWRTLARRGELRLAEVRSVHSASFSNAVTVEWAEGRRLVFARGPAIGDLITDLRRAAPHLKVDLPGRATRESILDPPVQRRLRLERRALFEYRRTG